MASSSETTRVARKPAKRAVASVVATRVALTLGTAAAAGLTAGKKEKRLSGRAHEQLFDAAAARSGLDGSELLEYALAKVALEDDFAEKLISLEGSIGRDIDPGF